MLEIAAASNRLLLTEDKDFGELVYRLRQAHAGVVLLRLSGLNSTERAELVVHVFRVREQDLPGNFTVIEPNSVRVRQVT